MRYDPPLLSGTLIERYKRFLADITLEDGRVVTAHTPNSGSMMGCSTPGSPVLVKSADKPSRKLKWDWEQIFVDGQWVGVRPVLANDLVEEAINAGVIEELQGYPSMRREVGYGSQRSRIDILLEDPSAGTRCYCEVKSVSLARGDQGHFPDAVSKRGAKHLAELMEMKAGGDRAVMLFCVQREDVVEVRPADDIDPAYGKILREAQAAGVELLAYKVRLNREEIAISTRVPVVLPPLD